MRDIIYKGTEAQIQQCAGPDGTVPLVWHNLGISGLPAPSLCHRERGLTMSRPVLWQVCGVVFFSSDAAEQLLATHVIPPLDACTYMGLDSGAPPIQVTAPLWGTGPLSPWVLLFSISVGPVCPHTARLGWEGCTQSSSVAAVPSLLSSPSSSTSCCAWQEE